METSFDILEIMTSEILRTKSKDEILNFIREKLAFKSDLIAQLRHVNENDFKKEHRRFEMSGYESKTGQCTIFNAAVLNEFAGLGIYDYTSYLFLDFYKGTPTLYLKYFWEEENLIFEFNGYTTSEIIYEIFQLTIFSNKRKRRR